MQHIRLSNEDLLLTLWYPVLALAICRGGGGAWLSGTALAWHAGLSFNPHLKESEQR